MCKRGNSRGLASIPEGAGDGHEQETDGQRATVPAKRVPQEGAGSAELKFTRSGHELKLRQIFMEGCAYSYELEP